MPPRTASDVIAIFEELGLPVCDDPSAIAQKVVGQRDRRLRDTRSTSPSVRHRAGEWFKDVADLQQGRQGLVNIVYELFEDLADAALAAGVAAGLNTLTAALREALLRLASHQCRVNANLAGRFLAEYYRKRQLEPGGPISCVPRPDVSHLTLSVTRDGAILRWVWPAGCTAARVVRREGVRPEGRSDPLAACFPCTAQDYLAAGERFMDPIDQGPAQYHYVVYAQFVGDHGPQFSPGVDPDCHAVLSWRPWTTVRYRLGPVVAGPGQGRDLCLTWSVDSPTTDFSGLVLVARPDRVPTRPGDGITLFRSTPEPCGIGGSQEATVSLDPIRERRWTCFFAKALSPDPGQDRSTLIIHPDCCVPISDTGKVETPRPFGEHRPLRGRAPRSVLCPSCFESFPVERMLFGQPGGGAAAVPARRTWIDRLASRPARPPVDERGACCPANPAPNAAPISPSPRACKTTFSSA